jgi:hypothetical protein
MCATWRLGNESACVLEDVAEMLGRGEQTEWPLNCFAATLTPPKKVLSKNLDRLRARLYRCSWQAPLCTGQMLLLTTQPEAGSVSLAV